MSCGISSIATLDGVRKAISQECSGSAAWNKETYKKCIEIINSHNAENLASAMKYKKSLFSFSCSNFCKMIFCCSKINICSPTTNVIVGDLKNGELFLSQKEVSKEMSADEKQMTSVMLFMYLYKIYESQLPMLIEYSKKMLERAPEDYRVFWEAWNPTCTEPLSSAMVSYFKNLLADAAEVYSQFRKRVLLESMIHEAAPKVLPSPPRLLAASVESVQLEPLDESFAPKMKCKIACEEDFSPSFTEEPIQACASSENDGLSQVAIQSELQLASSPKSPKKLVTKGSVKKSKDPTSQERIVKYIEKSDVIEEFSLEFLVKDILSIAKISKQEATRYAGEVFDRIDLNSTSKQVWEVLHDVLHEHHVRFKTQKNDKVAELLDEILMTRKLESAEELDPNEFMMLMDASKGKSPSKSEKGKMTRTPLKPVSAQTLSQAVWV